MKTMQTLVQDVLQELHVLLNNMTIYGESLISTEKISITKIYIHAPVEKYIYIFPTTKIVINNAA